MPRPRLPFVCHRTADQIRAKYRSCRHPVEKPRWHALWLLARSAEGRKYVETALKEKNPDLRITGIRTA